MSSLGKGSLWENSLLSVKGFRLLFSIISTTLRGVGEVVDTLCKSLSFAHVLKLQASNVSFT